MPKYKKLHVATEGLKRSRSGSLVPLTAYDIRELAESYEPSLHECKISVDDVNTAVELGAPAVLGHFDTRTVAAKGAMPAFGKVQSAQADSDGLYLDLELTDKMADWISEGLYDHVSLSWYERDDPRNPTPGKLHIRHIGWLGAEPSAMKDLELPKADLIEFSELPNGETETIVKNVYFSVTDGDKQNMQDLKAKEMAEQDQQDMANAGATSSADTSGVAGAQQTAVDPVLMLVSVLQDGPKGYKGEISEFRPEPTAENSYLWDDEAKQFKGQFVDVSGNEEEVYNFTIKLQPDGTMQRSYQIVSTEEPTDATVEAEADAAALGEDESSTEFSEPMLMPMYADKVVLSQQEYDALMNKASMAELLLEERRLSQYNEQYEQLCEALQPLYSMGLVSFDLDCQKLAKAIMAMSESASQEDRDEYCETEFGEAKVSPFGLVLETFKAVSANAKRVTSGELLDVEFGESVIDESVVEDEGLKVPAGVTKSPEMSEMDSKVRKYCKDNGLDPVKDYVKALKAVSKQ